MASRASAPQQRSTGATATVDLVLCALDAGHGLAVLLTPQGRRGRWALPSEVLPGGTDPAHVAAVLAARILGRPAAWMVQVGAFGGASGEIDDAALSVVYVAVTDHCDGAANATWRRSGDLQGLAGRTRTIVGAGLAALRDYMDREPVAFRLLPPTFTLSALQGVYELLLGRRLHKASFRRMLQAAFLVQPTDEWRRDGRGRPAQLFRFAPHRRHGKRQGLRFDLLER